MAWPAHKKLCNIQGKDFAAHKNVLQWDTLSPTASAMNRRQNINLPKKHVDELTSNMQPILCNRTGVVSILYNDHRWSYVCAYICDGGFPSEITRLPYRVHLSNTHVERWVCVHVCMPLSVLSMVNLPSPSSNGESPERWTWTHIIFATGNLCASQLTDL